MDIYNYLGAFISRIDICNYKIKKIYKHKLNSILNNVDSLKASNLYFSYYYFHYLTLTEDINFNVKYEKIKN